MFTSEDQDKLRLAEFAALEPIDAHTHIAQASPEFLAMLERLHMHVLDILFVNHHMPYRASLKPQRQDALDFIASSTRHARLCTTFDSFLLDNPNFSQNAIVGLNQDFQRGAIAVKIWKNVGMEIKSSAGEYVNVDDPIFQPIYQDIAAHNKTLIVQLLILTQPGRRSMRKARRIMPKTLSGACRRSLTRSKKVPSSMPEIASLP